MPHTAGNLPLEVVMLCLKFIFIGVKLGRPVMGLASLIQSCTVSRRSTRNELLPKQLIVRGAFSACRCKRKHKNGLRQLSLYFCMVDGYFNCWTQPPPVGVEAKCPSWPEPWSLHNIAQCSACQSQVIAWHHEHHVASCFLCQTVYTTVIHGHSVPRSYSKSETCTRFLMP